MGKLHSTARWQRVRRQQLREHPWCAMCACHGVVEPATIADHVEPHHGDVNKFWLGELQSLCKPCHDGAKQSFESKGYRDEIGADGWPVDPKHPVNSSVRRDG